MSETTVSTSRLVSIDLARFIAITAMFCAHTMPSHGPAGIFNLSSFLAAPLFGMLLGISTYLSSRKMALPMLFASSVVRALILIVLGLYLQYQGAGIDVILPVLGLLGIVAVPLVVAPSWLLGAIAAISLFFTQQVATYFVPWVARAEAKDQYLGLAVQWLFTGQHYRVFTMLCWAAVGIILIRLMKVWGPAGDIATFLLTGLGVAALLWYTRPTDTLIVYSGDYLEIGFNTLFCLCVISLCAIVDRILATKENLLAPFLLMGRMSLSLYVLQVYALGSFTTYLVAYSEYRYSWLTLALLFILSLVFCLLWDRLLGRTFVRRGPLESVLAWTTGRG